MRELLLLSSRKTWHEFAACAGFDSEAFFPEVGSNVSDLVKKVCHRCPVRHDCLEEAIRNKEEGFWGGMNERERQQLRARRNKAAKA